jgi:hypothetical protein
VQHTLTEYDRLIGSVSHHYDYDASAIDGSRGCMVDDDDDDDVVWTVWMS